MSKEEILKRVQDIFIDVLQNENIVLNYNTTPDDIEGWDSLNNILLILEIEKEFNFKFKLEEILSFKNIGGMCNNILIKIRD